MMELQYYGARVQRPGLSTVCMNAAVRQLDLRLQADFVAIESTGRNSGYHSSPKANTNMRFAVIIEPFAPARQEWVNC